MPPDGQGRATYRKLCSTASNMQAVITPTLSPVERLELDRIAQELEDPQVSTERLIEMLSEVVAIARRYRVTGGPVNLRSRQCAAIAQLPGKTRFRRRANLEMFCLRSPRLERPSPINFAVPHTAASASSHRSIRIYAQQPVRWRMTISRVGQDGARPTLEYEKGPM